MTTELEIVTEWSATQKSVLAALRLGATRKAAAESAGIARSTLYLWMANPMFERAVLLAEASAERAFSNVIFSAAQGGDWRAAAWWLERRRSEDWGNRVQMEARADREVERLLDEMLEKVYGEVSDAETACTEK